MSKSQEQLDVELMMSLLPTLDEMFDKIFPAKMFCEGDAELIEDIEDVVDKDEEKNNDQE